VREKGAMPNQSQHASLSRPFEIRTRQDADATTVTISGELDLASVDQLSDAIRAAEESSRRSIVLDLSELSFMDSTGLSALLAARKRASENNHQLRFLPSRHDQVQQVLSITETNELIS
jgi:anti-sigma B factor antagonist